MKTILSFTALCMLIITSCIKDQITPKSIASEIVSKAAYLDDFVLSGNLRPRFRKIDSATTVTVFSDSVYNNFGGSIRHIGFQFSNPDIVYRNLKLIVSGINGEQHSSYIVEQPITNNGVKEFVFDDPNVGISLYPGWNKIVVKAKIFGKTGDSFHVTIPEGYITYYSINDEPGGVVGLPVSTKGLQIR
jgi:hypothetical protein